VSLVVLVIRASLAVGTEIQVVADRALVSGATNVGRISVTSIAKRSITADANVNSCWSTEADIRERLVDRRKSVARVTGPDSLDAVGTVVPIRAIKTLVANAKDVLVAAITNSVMHVVASRAHLDFDVARHLGPLHSRGETVLGVVTMRVLSKAWLAKIKVLAHTTMKELGLGVFLDTAVACSHNARQRGRSRERLGESFGEWHMLGLGLNLGLHDSLDLDLGLGLGLRGDRLSGTLNQQSVDSWSFNQPVVSAMAGNALFYARLTEVKVAVVAGGAMIMDIGDVLLAAVTADSKASASRRT
jgi:hypothetical protein